MRRIENRNRNASADGTVGPRDQNSSEQATNNSAATTTAGDSDSDSDVPRPFSTKFSEANEWADTPNGRNEISTTVAWMFSW